MSKNKTNRTQLKDIAADMQELTANEASKVIGGAGSPAPTPTPTPTPTTGTTTPTGPAAIKAGYDLKQNKAV